LPIVDCKQLSTACVDPVMSSHSADDDDDVTPMTSAVVALSTCDVTVVVVFLESSVCSSDYVIVTSTCYVVRFEEVVYQLDWRR